MSATGGGLPRRQLWRQSQAAARHRPASHSSTQPAPFENVRKTSTWAASSTMIASKPSNGAALPPFVHPGAPPALGSSCSSSPPALLSVAATTSLCRGGQTGIHTL